VLGLHPVRRCIPRDTPIVLEGRSAAKEALPEQEVSIVMMWWSGGGSAWPGLLFAIVCMVTMVWMMSHGSHASYGSDGSHSEEPDGLSAAEAGIMLTTAAVGFCPAYVPFGISTRGGLSTHGRMRLGGRSRVVAQH
jgi:hypothetical protein